MREHDLGIITRILIWFSLAIFIFSWAFNLLLRIIGASIGIICLISLSYIFHIEKLKKRNMQNSIKALKNAYNELDEQAKLMAQTDLELNKIQEELDKKITGLYTLHEWGNKADQTFSISELLDPITKDFVSKLGFQKAMIVIINEKLKQLQLRKAINYSSQLTQKIEKEINQKTLFTKLLSKAETLLISKVNSHDPSEKQLGDILGLSSFVITPILQQDTAFGLVIMGNESPYNKVTEGDLELVSIFASQIGITMQNSTLYEQLWKSQQDLQNRVKKRTKELAEANEELERLNKVKSDFVSSVTHELRTPLTSIKGFTSILIDGRLGKVPSEQLERLKKIRKHSSNLARLINNLLDISRIESGRVEMQKEEIPVKNILENVMEIIQSQIKNKNIHFSRSFNPENLKLWVDYNQLERVFINLLGNAVKFTPKEGKIVIKAHLTNNSVKVSILNTGPTISEKDLPHIFEEFYRGDNEPEQKEMGSGLGLSLVKKVIEAHNGEIWAESKSNKTTFNFMIPIKEETYKDDSKESFNS